MKTQSTPGAGQAADGPLTRVTGATGGIGLAIARDLGSRGHRVLICARTETTREALTNGGLASAGRGRIVNIASTAGKHGVLLGAPYTASKHAVVGLTKALGKELAPRGITVNGVCPGYVETPMAARVRAGYARVWDTTEQYVQPGPPWPWWTTAVCGRVRVGAAPGRRGRCPSSVRRAPSRRAAPCSRPSRPASRLTPPRSPGSTRHWPPTWPYGSRWPPSSTSSFS